MLPAAVAVTLVATLLSPLAGAQTAGASTPEQVREALERIREAPIQWELPRPDESGGISLPWFSGLPLLSILLFTLAAVAVVVLALYIASALRDRQRPAVVDPSGAPAGTAAVRLSGEPLARAEALAREARYAEAIHILLLGTIEEIRTSLGYVAHPSLTSREILRRAPLPVGAEAPLGGIVREVEWSHFGARGAGDAEYRRCVEWHGELRRACDGAAAGGGRERGGRRDPSR
jgi:hypothetical protein